MAILSVLVALLAGSLDAMLWREAQRRAERAHVEADIAAERAALVQEYEDRRAAGEAPDYRPDGPGEFKLCGNDDL